MSEAESESSHQASALVRRIRDGDGSAEAELFELYNRGISYLLRRLTGDPFLSEDLEQETFRVVLEKARAGHIREPEKLAGFLRSTAKNLARAEFRKGRRRPRAEELETAAEPEDPAPSPLARVVREEDKRRVRLLLAELRSDRDRQILYRFHLAEESKEEICRSLGLSSMQFNLVLFRARQRFRKLVEATAR